MGDEATTVPLKNPGSSIHEHRWTVTRSKDSTFHPILFFIHASLFVVARYHQLCGENVNELLSYFVPGIALRTVITCRFTWRN